MVTSVPLSAVTSLLSEFHSPYTDNVRKHEIEKQLFAIQQDSNAWTQCLQALNNFYDMDPKSSNEWFWFFNVTTIELTIRRKWKYLSTIERNQLRNNLWQIYTRLQSTETSHCHREKLAQLIVLIGKRQFPDEHSMYMCHIMELFNNNYLLAITLLRATSEESIDTRDTLTSDQRKYFHSNLIMCMPQVFHLLTQLLVIHVYGVKGINLDTITNDCVEKQLIKALSKDVSYSTSAMELLVCVQNLLSWVPLDGMFQEQFLISLFELAASWREDNKLVPVAALTAIAEIFYRQQMLPFPHIILSGIQSVMRQPQLLTIEDNYQDKLTELVRLFVSQQWSKLIDDDRIFTDLITTISTFTLTSYSHFAFSDKLSIWHPIIKGLGPRGFGQYANTMHSLVSEILRKIQTRLDPDLNEIDNETLDDDMQTDWQQFLTQCIETIALVAEYQPQQVFEQVYLEWQKPFEIFESLEKNINLNGSLIINDNQRSDMLFCVLRDLATMCQTLTRLMTTMQGNGHDIPRNLSQITYCLLNAIKFIAINKLHSATYASNKLTVVSGFADTFAQLLNSVRNLLPWSPIIQNENELKSLIEYVAQILLPPSNIAHDFNPRLLTLAAAQFLLTVSSTIRPRYLLDCPSFKQLIQLGAQMSYMDKLAAKTVRNAIVNSFVLPWPNVPNNNQVFEQRSVMLEEYIDNLSQNLLNLDHSAAVPSQHEKIIGILSIVLPALCDILDYHRDSMTAVKHMLMHSFKSSIAKSLMIYTQFGVTNERIASGVLEFVIAILQTLQNQMGAQHIREMLDTILKTSTCEQLTTNQLKAMDKLMKMLLLVVQQPGNLGLCLLPSILDLALNYVMPLLMQTQNANEYCDVVMSLFQLFDGILQNRWQYFYKSQVLRGFSPCASDQTIPYEEDQPQHIDELIAILTAYGHGIGQSINPQITNTILTSLHTLHERWKLYDRECFKTNLLAAFVEALLKLIISSTGILHYDQSISILFSLAQSCLQVLHTMLAAFYENAGQKPAPKLVEEICMAKDFPTFAAKMALFTQDLKSFEFQ